MVTVSLNAWPFMGPLAWQTVEYPQILSQGTCHWQWGTTKQIQYIYEILLPVLGRHSTFFVWGHVSIYLTLTPNLRVHCGTNMQTNLPASFCGFYPTTGVIFGWPCYVHSLSQWLVVHRAVGTANNKTSSNLITGDLQLNIRHYKANTVHLHNFLASVGETFNIFCFRTCVDLYHNYPKPESSLWDQHAD